MSTIYIEVEAREDDGYSYGINHRYVVRLNSCFRSAEVDRWWMEYQGSNIWYPHKWDITHLRFVRLIPPEEIPAHLRARNE